MIDQDLRPWLIEVNASPSLTANTREDYQMKTEMLHGIRLLRIYFLSKTFFGSLSYEKCHFKGMLDVVDMEGQLQGDEEHISGWDLVYDNGYIEIDPSQCGYTTFLGSAVPEPNVMAEELLASSNLSYSSKSVALKSSYNPYATVESVQDRGNSNLNSMKADRPQLSTFIGRK